MFGFIPVFVKSTYDELEPIGKNKIWDLMLDIFIKIDTEFELGYTFEVLVNEKPL